MNRQTVKVSYCAMSNVNSQTAGFNKQKLYPSMYPELEKTCSCRQNPCPLSKPCNAQDIVYQGRIKYDGSTKIEKYYCITAGKLARRFGIHKRSFKNPAFKTDTALSNRYHVLKDQGEKPRSIFFNCQTS